MNAATPVPSRPADVVAPSTPPRPPSSRPDLLAELIRERAAENFHSHHIRERAAMVVQGAVRWRRRLLHRRKCARYDAIVEVMRAAGRVSSEPSTRMKPDAPARPPTLSITTDELLSNPGIAFSPARQSSSTRREGVGWGDSGASEAAGGAAGGSAGGASEAAEPPPPPPSSAMEPLSGAASGEHMLGVLSKLRAGLGELGLPLEWQNLPLLKIKKMLS